jgi:hypothetical protein
MEDISYELMLLNIVGDNIDIRTIKENGYFNLY